MQTKHLSVLIYIWTKGEVGAPWNRFKPPPPPPSKIFLLTVPRRHFFCGSFTLFVSCFCYAFVRVCLLMPCGHLLGKGWPFGPRLWCLFVNFVTFPLVSWVRCGAWLYQFLIIALFLCMFYKAFPAIYCCNIDTILAQYCGNSLWQYCRNIVAILDFACKLNIAAGRISGSIAGFSGNIAFSVKSETVHYMH